MAASSARRTASTPVQAVSLVSNIGTPSFIGIVLSSKGGVMGISNRCISANIVIVALVLALAVTSAAGASEPVRKGVDVWVTVAGKAHTSFVNEPIPAGFFCLDSG